MVRFVVGPDGAVVPDIRARLPGRGAWVDGLAGTVELAIKRKAFARTFKRDCSVDAGLAAQVDQLLEQDALQALSFANKAGHVICGATKVEAALSGGGVRAVIHAKEGRSDGARKIEAVIRRVSREGASEPVRIQIFSSDQLDLAIGRSNVIHAALLSGGASDAFVTRAARLERFRGESPSRAPESFDVPASSET